MLTLYAHYVLGWPESGTRNCRTNCCTQSSATRQNTRQCPLRFDKIPAKQSLRYNSPNDGL